MMPVPQLPGSSPSFNCNDLDRIKTELEHLQQSRNGGRGHLAPAPRPPPAGVKRPSVLAHALSGAMGAVLAEVVLFPVDTIKLRTQTATAGETIGFFGHVVNIMREKGIAGLYQGISTSVLKESVHSFNYWCFHEVIFRCLSKGDNSKTSTGKRLFLNLIIKQLNWVCTVPFEVISSVNQLTPNSPGFIATAMLLYKQGGVGYFYRGLKLSLVLAINPAIMNTLITTFLRAAALFKMSQGQDYETARDHSSAAIGTATGVAKFIATLATYPIIRAKVLQQTTISRKEMSPFKIWADIVKVEGVLGLYRGLLAMSYKTVLWNAFMMAVKNRLGPKRLATPPLTPVPMAPMTPSAIFMGRDAFNDETAVAKLDEIVQHLRGDRSNKMENKVQVLEKQIGSVSEEMRDIKGLLQCLVRETSGGGLASPAAAFASGSPAA
uniref:Uncharacterized protein n=1 Tax=Zooxanthella nutricula TaxID=1333877 RepID=A0A7S2MLM6_9DINO